MSEWSPVCSSRTAGKVCGWEDAQQRLAKCDSLRLFLLESIRCMERCTHHKWTAQ